MEPPTGRFDGPPPKERVFNAPLVAVLLAVSMPALYVLQERSRDFWSGLAFAPIDLAEGRFAGLFTSMLAHGSWPHVLTNAAMALAFGAPVARLFKGGFGVLVFLALYIVCGLAAGLGYALVHWGSPDGVVGSSGAVFGLVGGGIRLLGRGGRLAPLTDRRVIVTAAVLMIINAILGLIGFAPGVDGARIAWEAHAFGFLFGILAIGPLARLFARPDERFDSTAGLGDPPA